MVEGPCWGDVHVSINQSYYYKLQYMIIMTSVKWQFVAMKLCALLKKPELGGTFVAILMKSKKYVYDSSVFNVHVLRNARKPT